MSGDTYADRVRSIFRMMDIRHAMVSPQQIEDAVATVQRCRRTPLPSQCDPDAVARAQELVDATVHPDTGKPIFMPLRLSFIVPANMCLDALMVTALSPVAIVASQTLNQVYNALHYEAQRNATNDDTTSLTQRGLAFAGAVGGSVTAALKLSAFARRAPAGAWWALPLKAATPFLAVATADVLNVGTMRCNEYIQGINVYHPQSGELVGKSQRAGALAVASCVFARVTAAAPVLLTSGLASRVMENRGVPLRFRLPVVLTLLGVAIQFAVPVTFAVFSQRATVPTAWLEPHVRSVPYVEYNKGL